jgi:hypothetical protein
MKWFNTVVVSIGAALSSLFGLSHNSTVPKSVTNTSPVVAQQTTNSPSQVNSSQVPSSQVGMSQRQTYAGGNFSIKYPAGWSLQDPSASYHDTSGIFEGPNMADGFTPDLIYNIYPNGGSHNNVVLAVAAALAKHPALGQVSTSTISISGVTGVKVEEISKAVGGSWYNDDLYIVFQKGTPEYQLHGIFESTDPSRYDTFAAFYNSFQIK